MQREQEKEKRRLRDRQRRQSMTQEQREEHLARRRRNYQLRRQRAANTQGLDSGTGEISAVSSDLQMVTPTTSDNRIHFDGLNHGHETSQVVVEGSSIELEGPPRRLRLNDIKRLARNLTCPMSEPAGNHQVPTELIAKGDVSGGDGITPKTLRLNRVKRLARSMNFPSQETDVQKNHNDAVGGTNC